MEAELETATTESGGSDHGSVVKVGGVDERVRASRDSLLSVAAAVDAIATSAWREQG